MKIECSARGKLDVVETVNGLTLRFEETDWPTMQAMIVLNEAGTEVEGYDVRHFTDAKITLVIETEEMPQFAQRV